MARSSKKNVAVVTTSDTTTKDNEMTTIDYETATVDELNVKLDELIAKKEIETDEEVASVIDFDIHAIKQLIIVRKEAGMSEEELANEEKRMELESEIVRLQERLIEAKKELRAMTKKDGKGETGPTKMEQAVKYYSEHPGLARKDYVAAFMAELGLTLAGARTYIQIIKTKNK